MRRPVRLIVFPLLSLPLAGCATNALVMAPELPDRPWTPATNLTGEIVPGEPAPPEQPRNNTYVLPSNLALAGAPPPSDLALRHAYTLPELIDIAQSTNPATRNAWEDARNTALAAGIAESTFAPLISAGIVEGYQTFHGGAPALGTSMTGTTTTGISSTNTSTTGISTTGTSTTNDVTLKGSITALSILWLLFDFGERSALVDAAKQGSVISNIAFTAAHQQVIYNVSLAFYANAAARARFASSSQALKDAEEVQAAAESKYKQGEGTVVEVAETRQATAEARLERVKAEGDAQNDYLALISAIGISPTTKLNIADISHRKLSAAMAGSIDRIISAALARRTDVLTGYAALQASLASLRVAEAEFLPKIFLAANGARITGNVDVTALPGISLPGLAPQAPVLNLPAPQLGLSGNQLAATVLVGATVPLYDGGFRAALLEQARGRVDQASTTLTQIRNDAVRQIVMAGNGVKTSLSAYTASTSLAAAAQTTFNSALAAYRNGVGSLSDVTTAQHALLRAKNTATDAYSTALSAAATLALAAGALGGSPP